MSVADRTSGLFVRPRTLPRITLRGAGAILMLAGICALPIVLYAPFYSEPFMRDEGFYATVAQAMKHGGIPYRDAFDNKPPLIFGWYYVSFAMFGEHVWAPRLLVSLLLSGTTLLIYWQARFLYSSGRARVAAAAFAGSMGFAILETNANVEYFVLPPLVGALLCFTIGRRTERVMWLVAAGFLSGLAVMTKQTSVFCLPAFSLALAYLQYSKHHRNTIQQRRFWTEQTALLTGFIGAIAAVFAPFAVSGAGGNFIECVFIYSFGYVDNVPLATKALGLLFSPVWLVLVAGPWFVLSIIGVYCMLKRRESFDSCFAVVWLGAAAMGIIAAGRFYTHYYVLLLPAMALLIPAGLAVVDEQGRKSRNASAVVAMLMALSLLFPATSAGSIYLRGTADARHEAKYSYNYYSEWETHSRSLAAYLQARTAPGDYIYNLGFQSEVYFYADRRSPTRFVFDQPFQVNKDFEEEAIADLSRNKPAYVFDTAIYEKPGKLENYYSRPIHDWVAENYDYVGKIYYADIWRLKAANA